MFRNCMWDVTHNNSFGSGLTAFNEVCKRIDYIHEKIFLPSIDQTCALKIWQGTKIWLGKDIFQDMEIL